VAEQPKLEIEKEHRFRSVVMSKGRHPKNIYSVSYVPYMALSITLLSAAAFSQDVARASVSLQGRVPRASRHPTLIFRLIIIVLRLLCQNSQPTFMFRETRFFERFKVSREALEGCHSSQSPQSDENPEKAVLKNRTKQNSQYNHYETDLEGRNSNFDSHKT